MTADSVFVDELSVNSTALLMVPLSIVWRSEECNSEPTSLLVRLSPSTSSPSSIVIGFSLESPSSSSSSSSSSEGVEETVVLKSGGLSSQEV